MLSPRVTLITGAVAGGIAVALGAFGAHALKHLLVVHNAVETYTLAAQYQFYHALALLIVGVLADRAENKAVFGWTAFCMLTGIVLFSGSLYALATTGTRAVVLVTPLGGLFFLAGWALFVYAIAGNRKKITSGSNTGG